MKLISSIISVLALGLIGYTVGYLSGAVTGVAVYWKKAEREHKRQQILEHLDRSTTWDLSESE